MEDFERYMETTADFKFRQTGETIWLLRQIFHDNQLSFVAVRSFRFGFAGVVCQHSLYTVNVAAGKRLRLGAKK